jgi:hypothetical protein
MSFISLLKDLENTLHNADQSAKIAYQKLDTLDRAKADAIKKAGEAIDPIIRSCLEENWGHAGITSHSGDLHSAAVTSAQIVISPTNIKIRWSPGTPEKVIKYGASLNYGAAHVEGGRRLKKSIKQSGNAASYGGWIQPKLDFFKLSPAQIQRVNNVYNQSLAQSLTKAK